MTELTVKVTGKTWGGFDALRDAMVAVALYIPRPNPVGFIIRVTDWLVPPASEPEEELKVNHGSVDVADHCKVEPPPPVFCITIDCEEGPLLP
jgi:hypothetical protein